MGRALEQVGKCCKHRKGRGTGELAPDSVCEVVPQQMGSEVILDESARGGDVSRGAGR